MPGGNYFTFRVAVVFSTAADCGLAHFLTSGPARCCEARSRTTCFRGLSISGSRQTAIISVLACQGDCGDGARDYAMMAVLCRRERRTDNQQNRNKQNGRHFKAGAVKIYKSNRSPQQQWHCLPSCKRHLFILCGMGVPHPGDRGEEILIVLAKHTNASFSGMTGTAWRKKNDKQRRPCHAAVIFYHFNLHNLIYLLHSDSLIQSLRQGIRIAHVHN